MSISTMPTSSCHRPGAGYTNIWYPIWKEEIDMGISGVLFAILIGFVVGAIVEYRTKFIEKFRGE